MRQIWPKEIIHAEKKLKNQRRLRSNLAEFFGAMTTGISTLV